MERMVVYSAEKDVGIPDEFRNDPVLTWAENVASDPAVQDEQSLGAFRELQTRYIALLKRFSKVVRISDGYQRQLKDANTLLDSAAHTDFLTGLSNRRDVRERLEIELGRARRHNGSVSVILADIDGFKAVNDQYGHEAGDLVLTEVAHRLKIGVRREDLCARWGGEEFLFCLPETALADAIHVAEKLRSRIAAAPVEYRGTEIRVTISLGVAEDRGSSRADDVVRAADTALSAAKQGGKNRVATVRDVPDSDS